MKRRKIYLAVLLVIVFICIFVINVIWQCKEKQQQQQQQQHQQKQQQQQQQKQEKKQMNGVDSPILTFDQGCREKSKVCDINSKARSSIFYIKIHKTGSTALRSTLLTYGRRYNLTICMDATDLWGLNWPYEIDNVRLTKLHEEKCEIVAEELVYNKEKGMGLLKFEPTMNYKSSLS